MKKLALFFTFAIIIALCVTSCGKQATPASITSDCIEYIKDGNYAAYVETMNLPEKEKAEMQELMEKKGKTTIEELGGIDSYEITSEEISEDGLKAKVVASITYGNGKVDNSKFHFVKVDDEWKQEFNK